MITQSARPVARPQTSKADFTSLSDRMCYLLVLRVAMAGIIVIWAVLRPDALVVPFTTLGTITVAYLIVAVVAEIARRRASRFVYWIMTSMLLVDGLYLAGAMYVTGGTESPIRFLVYLQLVAVSLLASYRTGLKIALWHSLLLFVILYAQAAMLMPAVDVVPGVGITFDQMPVLNVTSFWLFAIATSIFSALNERELRQRRADLQTLVEVGAKLDAESDAIRQSDIVLDALVTRFGFERGVLLGESDSRVVVLAARGTAEAPTTSTEPDWIIRRAWERREILPVKSLDPERDPFLASLLPGARNVLVAPMIAEGRTVGAIVVEHRARRRTGVERRVAAMLGQFASMAALNLRNAVLLQHVQDLAERDSLTGAANRRMFQLALERVMRRRELKPRADSVTAVLFLDLDDFKVVNDTLGHAAGDALLVAVTERITSLVREGDLVARLGGDEFAILTEDEPMLSRSRSMASRLVYELRAPYVIGDKHVVVTASVGIASARDAVSGAADLVRNADVAMYMAKANGKSGFAIFDPGMHEAMRERHELSVDLQRAVDLDQLALLYQPIMDLPTGALAGVEALVRWQHPGHGLIMPGRFIEIAEETGAILPIGHWVLRQACREAARWLAEGRVGPEMFVSVNVSAREIQSLGFVDGVKAVLAEIRARSDPPGPRDHRDRPAQGDADHGRDPPCRARARRPDRHRRLRDRLLLAQPPPPVPDRRAQDRQRVRAGHRRRVEVVRTRRRDRGHEPFAGHRDRRRGHRDQRAGRSDARARLCLRSGLRVRQADAGGGPPRCVRDGCLAGGAAGEALEVGGSHRDQGRRRPARPPNGRQRLSGAHSNGARRAGGSRPGAGTKYASFYTSCLVLKLV